MWCALSWRQQQRHWCNTYTLIHHTYGIAVPLINNTLTQDAFIFMRNYIHFSRTQDQKKSGQSGYHPLFKVNTIIKMLMSRIRTVWIAGDRITIDESMIRYMGRAVAFIQYMPRKPIKHGIKVFAVCCAYIGVLLGFEVYCGSSAPDGTNNSAVAVVDRLLRDYWETTTSIRIAVAVYSIPTIGTRQWT